MNYNRQKYHKISDFGVSLESDISIKSFFVISLFFLSLFPCLYVAPPNQSFSLLVFSWFFQITFAVVGSITVQLVSSLTGLEVTNDERILLFSIK